MKSLDELFKLLNEFEEATNAKVNVDKTEALWVGRWRGRSDKPHNLKWSSDHVKFLGIYIGNKVGSSGTKKLSDLNFAEQIEKIKNKMNYWKGKGVSLFGRVKVLNIFVLSRLWYRTSIWSITKNQLKILQKMIGDFLWEGKRGARVRQGVMQMKFNEGGLQLVDIECKTKVQRLKRIIYLLNIDDKHFERFLADKLIGTDNKYGQNILSYGLISNKDRIKLIKNDFYREALLIANILDINFKPGNAKSFGNEPLFYNKAFLNTNGTVFTFSRFKKHLPKTVKELHKTSVSREIEVIDKIRKMKICLNNLVTSNKTNNGYFINIENEQRDINDLLFKDLYLKFLNMEPENKEWEKKWAVKLQKNNINWYQVWENVHNNLNNPYVISAQWEMLHLNYWSGYKAKERCRLCKEIEQSQFHIIFECIILKDILRNFEINDIYDENTSLSFGVYNQSLYNFILFHVKSVVFRSRFKIFTNLELCKAILNKKIKDNIKKDLNNRFFVAKHKRKVSKFISKYIPRSNQNYNPNYEIDNICYITDTQELIFTF